MPRGILPAAITLSAVALLSTRIPLLNALGYESSALVALVAAFVSGFLVIGGVRRTCAAEGAGWEWGTIRRVFVERFGWGMALLVLPLVILLANALFVKNCSIPHGLAFYLLLPVVTVWFSSALGLFCVVHYRFSRSVFTGAVLLTLAYAVVLGYATPAIFSYNFFYGFFPGLSYDEALGITLPLLLFRVLTIALGGVLCWLSFLIVTRSSRTDGTISRGLALLRGLMAPEWRFVSGAVVVALALLYLFRCELGWESTAGFIAGELGGEITTEHFVIYYPAGELNEAEVSRLAGEHEFRLTQLMRDMGVTEQERIASFIYPDAATKRRYIGTATTNIAKPWNNEIHLTMQTVEGTLKHELAHVVAGVFGFPVIRASWHTGLVEGLATAQEWTWGTRTLHQHAAAMREIGVLPDLRRVMSLTGFATHSTAAAYVGAGSFSRYLIDAYGVRKILAVYGGKSYDESFGRSQEELIREWEKFLGRLRVEPGDTAAAEYFFRRPTIFGKTCARVAAGWNTEAAAALNRGAYAEARSAYARIHAETGGLDAFGGLLAATFRMGDYAGVARLCDSVILRSEHPSLYLPLLLWCGDARWALGDPAGARELYLRVRSADLSEQLSEGAAVRFVALRDSTRATGWLRYLLAEPADSVRLRILDSLEVPADTGSGVPRYLRARILARTGKPVEALEILERLNMAAVSPDLEAIRQTTAARQWFLLGKYDAARPAFWMSQNVLTTEASVIQAREWVSRCDWMRAHAR